MRTVAKPTFCFLPFPDILIPRAICKLKMALRRGGRREEFLQQELADSLETRGNLVPFLSFRSRK